MKNTIESMSKHSKKGTVAATNDTVIVVQETTNCNNNQRTRIGWSKAQNKPKLTLHLIRGQVDCFLHFKIHKNNLSHEGMINVCLKQRPTDPPLNGWCSVLTNHINTYS